MFGEVIDQVKEFLGELNRENEARAKARHATLLTAIFMTRTSTDPEGNIVYDTATGVMPEVSDLLQGEVKMVELLFKNKKG